tara:strand:+ start:484 stop:639 length:156 start_codon:yes stop_codon:yes gene_type:complete
MTMYSMSTKTGSVITKKYADNLEEAINMFAKIKNLDRNQFLDIFIVEQINY